MSPSSLASQTATTLGPLADATPDIMTLHTQDAFRMFTGRAADSQTNAPAIPGGRRFAAVLKSIWYLSANDNPYADWILIRVQQALVTLREQMAREAVECEAEFEFLRRKGLSLSVLSSRSPATVALGFRSPYGYATAEAIVEFDRHVRMVKTLVLKDRLSDGQGRVAIREIGRGLRALFLEAIRWGQRLHPSANISVGLCGQAYVWVGRWRIAAAQHPMEDVSEKTHVLRSDGLAPP